MIRRHHLVFWIIRIFSTASMLLLSYFWRLIHWGFRLQIPNKLFFFFSIASLKRRVLLYGAFIEFRLTFLPLSLCLFLANFFPRLASWLDFLFRFPSLTLLVFIILLFCFFNIWLVLRIVLHTELLLFGLFLNRRVVDISTNSAVHDLLWGLMLLGLLLLLLLSLLCLKLDWLERRSLQFLWNLFMKIPCVAVHNVSSL